MLDWAREWWQKVTTSRCFTCGEFVKISEYRKTGQTRKGSGMFAGVSVELECPRCGGTFWAKK